ncbi:glycosyltransferase family 2 protein [Micromonospora sp. CPCC 205371]|nr:glycosyltransferase family 2 protein [Micromonospora sp. CPCC 205371]
MTIPGRYAVIATRDRPTELAVVVNALHKQHATVVVVDNGSEPRVSPPVDHDTDGPLPNAPTVIVDYEQPPNLSRLWNLGLDEAATQAANAGLQRWDIAVVNDDAVLPDGWFDACANAMRYIGAAAACSDPHSRITAPLVKTTPDRDAFTRMCGWAFVLRGELGFRFDETMRWWWSDSDADWAARAAGGMVIIPGYPVGNVHANSTTVGALAEQASRDRATFAAKWGWAPW